jgi:hypothetical protein
MKGLESHIFRFSEVQSTLKVKTNQHSNWDTVRFTRAESSSVLSYSWGYWWHWSYPAHNVNYLKKLTINQIFRPLMDGVIGVMILMQILKWSSGRVR